MGSQAVLERNCAVFFHTTWDKVRDAVQSVVNWGLEHRTLASIRSIGVELDL